MIIKAKSKLFHYLKIIDILKNFSGANCKKINVLADYLSSLGSCSLVNINAATTTTAMKTTTTMATTTLIRTTMKPPAPSSQDGLFGLLAFLVVIPISVGLLCRRRCNKKRKVKRGRWKPLIYCTLRTYWFFIWE